MEQKKIETQPWNGPMGYQKPADYVTPSCCHRNAPVRKETAQEAYQRRRDQVPFRGTPRYIKINEPK